MSEVREIHPLVKENILSIYQSFATICDKYNLKHWLGFGSMLGAVRHHGFIPWDDDFDVLMLREDYEKFLSIADKELPSYFKLVSHRNCSVYPMIFSKIQESRREVYESIENQSVYVSPTGMYIDIFPLDGMPSTSFGKFIDLCRYGVVYCRKLHLFRKSHSLLFGYIADFLGILLAPLFINKKTPNDFAFILDQMAKRYPTSNTQNVRIASLENRFQRKEYCFPREVFDDTEIITFENLKVPVPKNWDIVLRNLYGDSYMTPPPLEKRVSEHSKSPKAPWYYGPNVEN